MNEKLKEYESIQESLDNLIKLNEKNFSKFDLKTFVNELSNLIEEKLNKPRNSLIQEMSRGGLDFSNFNKESEMFQKFRELSINFHKFSIIRDKLNHKLIMEAQNL